MQKRHEAEKKIENNDAMPNVLSVRAIISFYFRQFL